MQLIDLATEKFDIGRAALLYQDVWDGTSNLFDDFVHAGTTEGEVAPEANSQYSNLTIEPTGPAILRRYLDGESPEFTIGVFPDPDKLALFSPTGRGSAGQRRRRRVKSYTLWVVAEQLFLATTAAGDEVEVEVGYTAGAFVKDTGGIVDGPRALTTEEQDLVDMSLIMWKADFGRLIPTHRHEDGGKSLRQVQVMCQQDLTKPDGCQLYLVLGELGDFATLDFEPES